MASALSIGQLKRPWTEGSGLTPFLPKWSKPSAMRAVRATVVIPSLFAITHEVFGNVQMATFAAFGGFATLVLVTFAGSRRDKLVAHLVLAMAGSVLLTIGTAVNSSVVLAALVTIPVAFVVFFAGIAGPNAAAGALAAMLPYVLPASSPGTISMVPDRLAGWWLASVAGTAAVMVFSPPSSDNGLGRALSKLSHALADQFDAMVRGDAGDDTLRPAVAAEHELIARFTATPFRPTGLARSDQANADAVELLEWCTSLCADSARERSDLSEAADVDRELVTATAAVLRDSGTLLAGGEARPDLERLEELRAASIARIHGLDRERADFDEEARASFHASAVAITTLAIGADALLAGRVVAPEWVAERRGRWFAGTTLPPRPQRRTGVLPAYTRLAREHASVRSVWFVNSLRSALALAAAVAVADLSSVQHGFWVVLGTLSVLRTNAAATGSTALRALLGTAIGFVVGGALLVAIGTSTTALWVALPIAIFVAAYAPGAAPFAIGQAGFTIVVAVLFNLLAPVGWNVGVLRIEDVAIGCAVSVLVGMVFWPRGVSPLVGNDLADAYRSGSSYLAEAVEWAIGLRSERPSAAMDAITAGLRLDDALRAFLAEQGTKHIREEQLWHLVGGSLRLRLTAHAVATLPATERSRCGAIGDQLSRRALMLDGWYGRLAAQLDRPRGPVRELVAPAFGGADGLDELDGSRHLIWLRENLDHLTEHLPELVEPAARLAEIRRRPWWR
ncbi:MAG TPA: FUSC family protein [Solirubrobacteraceae bacterium]